MNLLIARKMSIFDVFNFECNGDFDIVADGEDDSGDNCGSSNCPLVTDGGLCVDD